MAATAGALPLTSSARPVPAAAPVTGGVLLAAPLLLLAWLIRFGGQAPTPQMSFEHLVIVSNISLLALLVAVFVARSALQQKAYRVLLVALGFLSLAGFFSVHALATPGVILPAGGLVYSGGTYHEEHGASAVLGISAYLSLLIPALFFSSRYLPLHWRFSQIVVAQARVIVALAALLLVAYGVVGLTSPDTVAAFPLLSDPYVYIAAAISITLLLFAAWRQAQEYLATRLPMQAAQTAAFLLLADAQVAMVTAPVWGLAWWEYHLLMLAAVVASLWALFLELDRRRGFERFVSPVLVERVMSGETIQLGGERQTVTILFGDLRNSTALAEKLPPDAVVGVLNSYVGTMAQCVFDEGGILDKFLGDGLMAIFGVLPDPTHGAAAATRAAQAIRRSLGAINEERAARGEPRIGFGVGIHTGEVVLGAVGLPRRSDYTAIGDTVNTASRLESLCKQYHVDTVLSADVVSLLDPSSFPLTRLASAPIRGKEHEVEVFTLAPDA